MRNSQNESQDGYSCFDQISGRAAFVSHDLLQPSAKKHHQADDRQTG